MKQVINDQVNTTEHHVERNIDQPAEQSIEHSKERAENLQRDKYGGFNFGAAFFGWLVANSVGVLLVALLSALGAAVALTKLNNAQQAISQADTIGIIGAIGLLIVLGTAYYAGGYVAGRMSRFDGGRQGFGVWLMGIIATIALAVAGALFGSKFNLLQQLNLPAIPVSGSSFTTAGALTLLAILVVTALTAIAGGKVGSRYHQKVNALGQSAEGERSQNLGGNFAHQR